MEEKNNQQEIDRLKVELNRVFGQKDISKFVEEKLAKHNSEAAEKLQYSKEVPV